MREFAVSMLEFDCIRTSDFILTSSSKRSDGNDEEQEAHLARIVIGLYLSEPLKLNLIELNLMTETRHRLSASERHLSISIQWSVYLNGNKLFSQKFGLTVVSLSACAFIM